MAQALGQNLPQKLMEIQRTIEQESNEIKKIEVEYTKVVNGKRSLTEKKSENDSVMAEFKMLDDDANVFKMVGPILAKQSLFECKDNV